MEWSTRDAQGEPVALRPGDLYATGIVTVSAVSGADRDGGENGVESWRGRWAEVGQNSVPGARTVS
jgi:hypothetical protein